MLKRFIIGLALTILVGQLPALFGVEKGEGNFFEKLWDLVTQLDETSWLTLGVGLVSLALLLTLKGLVPRAPGSLVVVALAVLVATVLDLGDHVLELVGSITPGLPGIGVPDASLHRYLHLVGPAAGVMLVGFAEGQLFFGNCDFVRDRIRALAADSEGVRLVVLDGQTSPWLDVSSVQMLGQLREDLERQDVRLALAHGIAQVRDVLARAAASEQEPALFATVDDAVASISG